MHFEEVLVLVDLLVNFAAEVRRGHLQLVLDLAHLHVLVVELEKELDGNFDVIHAVGDGTELALAAASVREHVDVPADGEGMGILLDVCPEAIDLALEDDVGEDLDHLFGVGEVELGGGEEAESGVNEFVGAKDAVLLCFWRLGLFELLKLGDGKAPHLLILLGSGDAELVGGDPLQRL